jgi:hypothetical protein
MAGKGSADGSGMKPKVKAGFAAAWQQNRPSDWKSAIYRGGSPEPGWHGKKNVCKITINKVIFIKF